MDSITFAWAIAATVLAGMQMFTAKMIAHAGRSSAYNSIYTYGISGVIAFIGLFFAGSQPSSWEWVLFLAVASGALHAGAHIMRIDALRYIDSTLYFPLNKILGPILVVLGGVLMLGENITVKNTIGIILSLCVPLLLISSSEHGRQKNLRKGITFVVLSTAIASGSMLMTKLGVDIDKNVLFFMFLSQLGGTLFALYMYRRENAEKQYVPERKDMLIGVCSGLLAFVSFYALLRAFSMGSISLVYTIHAHYIVIPIFLSVWFYKEHMNMRKFAAVVLSVVAIGLLY
jgi:uncharacterized membrane protein